MYYDEHMRIRVSYTTEVSDDYRRAVSLWYGEDRLATREEVKRWLHAYGSSMDDDIMSEMQERDKKDAEEKDDD